MLERQGSSVALTGYADTGPIYARRAAPTVAGGQTFSRQQGTEHRPTFDNTLSKQADMRAAHVKEFEAALGQRFKSMYNAFQYMDKDRSGTLSFQEISRALKLWKVEMDRDKLKDLMRQCDQDANGDVDYQEFVDVLSRNFSGTTAVPKKDQARLLGIQ